MLVVTLALGAIAVLDDATMARLPVAPRALHLSVLCYAVVAAVTWLLASSTELASALTCLRYLLLAVMGAYATSFVPLAIYALPAALAVAATTDARVAARALRWPLIGFILMSFGLGVGALVVALRSEAVNRVRLEGIVLFASFTQALWHTGSGAAAVYLATAVRAFERGGDVPAADRVALAYRRSWLFCAIGLCLTVALFVLTAIFVQLERAMGLPR